MSPRALVVPVIIPGRMWCRAPVQGVIPLGSTTVDYVSGLHNGKDALAVRHRSYGGRQLVVSADSDAELRRWEAAIQQCRLVYVPHSTRVWIVGAGRA